MKQGSSTANTLGTLAVMYSGFGVLLQWVRGEDDEINTLLAGTATGLLYKSTGKRWILLKKFKLFFNPSTCRYLKSSSKFIVA